MIEKLVEIVTFLCKNKVYRTYYFWDEILFFHFHILNYSTSRNILGGSCGCWKSLFTIKIQQNTRKYQRDKISSYNRYSKVLPQLHIIIYCNRNISYINAIVLITYWRHYHTHIHYVSSQREYHTPTNVIVSISTRLSYPYKRD